MEDDIGYVDPGAPAILKVKQTLFDSDSGCLFLTVATHEIENLIDVFLTLALVYVLDYPSGGCSIGLQEILRCIGLYYEKKAQNQKNIENNRQSIDVAPRLIGRKNLLASIVLWQDDGGESCDQRAHIQGEGIDRRAGAKHLQWHILIHHAVACHCEDSRSIAIHEPSYK